MNIEEINEFLYEHNAKYENGTLTLSILCDSTRLFLLQMVEFLKMLGCTDIKTDGYVENDSVYGYRYVVSGKVPKKLKDKFIKC